MKTWQEAYAEYEAARAAGSSFDREQVLRMRAATLAMLVMSLELDAKARRN